MTEQADVGGGQLRTDEAPSLVAKRPEVRDGRSAADVTGRRRLAWLLGTVAGGWLVSGLAVHAGVDWVLLPLLVLAIASTLRAGRGLLDRLMLATVLFAGVLVTGGLLYSLWPWGLAPFPVAGSLFTAIAVAAWAGRSRPRLTLAASFSDLIILGTGGLVMYACLRPLRRLTSLEWVGAAFSAEDRAAHFALFDTIHRLGSYPFLDQVAARVPLRPPTEADYPAGSHFLYAVIDIFVRSTTDPGPAVAAFGRYFVYALAAYAFLIMATVWAARWVFGPLVQGWRVAAATAVVSALLVSGPYMPLIAAGFDSQVLGLAFVGITAALAFRSPHRIGEWALLLGAGVVLVAYTYYLYLPLVVVAVVASFVVDRRRLLPSWRFLAVAAAVVGAVSVLPLYFAIASTLSIKDQALSPSGGQDVPWSMVVAATVAALGILLIPGALRQRRVRIIALTVPAMAGIVLVFGLYQVLSMGRTSYYFSKLLMCYLFVCIICATTLVLILRPITFAGRTIRYGQLREFAAGVAAAAVAFTAIGGFSVGPHLRSAFSGQWKASSLGGWFWHKPGGGLPADLTYLARHGVLADGTPSLIVTSGDGYTNWRMTFLNGSLNRTNGVIMKPTDVLLKTPTVPPAGNPGRQEALRTEVEQLAKAVSISPVPLRIVLRDKDMADALSRRLAADGQSRGTVMLLPTV